MTIANGYITQAEFKLYANIGTTDANDDLVIDELVEGTSRLIDDLTGRTFYARSLTNYYDVPVGRQIDLTDDLLTITKLTNGDGDEILLAEYNLIPKNHAPYHAIRLKEASTEVWELDDEGNSEMVISVQGTWGYSATAPDDIKTACYQLAQQAYKERFGENTGGVSTITAWGVVVTPQDIPGSAWQVLKRYRKML